MKKLTILLLSMLLTTIGFGQEYNCYEKDARAASRDHQVDISHMLLEVSFDTEKGKVNGEVTHTFRSLRKSIDTLFFDAPGIEIKSAELDNKPVDYKISKEGVTVIFKKPLTWDKDHEIEFEYTAFPRKGIYFIGWNAPAHNDARNMTRRQIWTQGQGIDNRHWIPMYDNMNDKFVTETIITFDKEYKVLSNGALLSKKNKGKNIVWHYKLNNPHAGYLLMLAIDKFAIKETKTSRGTPVQFWYYPEHPEKVELTSLHTEKIIEFLEDETGVKYPWGTYAQVMVQDFMYGAMENTSATIFGDFFYVDKRSFHDRNYIGVNAHELTHQWFGDMITARSSAHAWLQESFATFYAKKFFKTIHGINAVKWNQRGEVNTALAASLKNNKPIMNTGSGSQRIYQKGSSVLQMLEYVMGEEHFKKAIKHFLNQYAFKNCDTDDLRNAIMDATGMNMDWFFDQWIKKGGEPHYKVSYVNLESVTQISVEQIHQQNATTGLFKMPIKFAVHYKDGSIYRRTEWIENVHHFVKIPNGDKKEVAFVLFDENSEITKQVTFEKSEKELKTQFEKSPYMMDKYDALVGLRNVPLEDKKDLLLTEFNKEPFWAIRGEIASQLASADKSTIALLYKDKHAKSRGNLIRSLAVNDNTIETLVKATQDSSYSNSLAALNKMMNSEAKREYKLAALNSCMDVLGHNHNIKIAWLEHSATFYPEENYQFLSLLMSYSSNLYEFKTRVNAMNALKRLNVFDEVLMAHLLDAGISTNRRLAGPARGVYHYFASQPKYVSIMEAYFAKTKYSMKTMQLIEAAGMKK